MMHIINFSSFIRHIILKKKKRVQTNLKEDIKTCYKCVLLYNIIFKASYIFYWTVGHGMTDMAGIWKSSCTVIGLSYIFNMHVTRWTKLWPKIRKETFNQVQGKLKTQMWTIYFKLKCAIFCKARKILWRMIWRLFSINHLKFLLTLNRFADPSLILQNQSSIPWLRRFIATQSRHIFWIKCPHKKKEEMLHLPDPLPSKDRGKTHNNWK